LDVPMISLRKIKCEDSERVIFVVINAWIEMMPQFPPDATPL
jgi:hypothetical protein